MRENVFEIQLLLRRQSGIFIAVECIAGLLNNVPDNFKSIWTDQITSFILQRYPMLRNCQMKLRRLFSWLFDQCSNRFDVSSVDNLATVACVVLHTVAM